MEEALEDDDGESHGGGEGEEDAGEEVEGRDRGAEHEGEDDEDGGEGEGGDDPEVAVGGVLEIDEKGAGAPDDESGTGQRRAGEGPGRLARQSADDLEGSPVIGVSPQREDETGGMRVGGEEEPDALTEGGGSRQDSGVEAETGGAGQGGGERCDVDRAGHEAQGGDVGVAAGERGQVLKGERRAGWLGDRADLAQAGVAPERVREAVDGGQGVVIEQGSVAVDDEVEGGERAAGVVGGEGLEAAAGLGRGGEFGHKVEGLVHGEEAGGGGEEQCDPADEEEGGVPLDEPGDADPAVGGPGGGEGGAGPERVAPGQAQQRRGEGETGEEDDGDRHGEGGADGAEEKESGGEESEESEDDSARRRGDHRPHGPDRPGECPYPFGAGPELFPVAGDYEEAVVGAGPEGEDDHPRFGQAGHLHPLLGEDRHQTAGD